MTDLFFAMKMTEGMGFQDFLLFIGTFITVVGSFCFVVNYLIKLRDKK